MLKNIAGRQIELQKLKRALESDKAEFIAVYGRRRIGKTFLIREFFGERIGFELIGIYNASLQEQLDNFANSMCEALKIDIPVKSPASWQEAFSMLKNFLESKKGKAKKVVFLDELPWLNSSRSGFLKQLEHFWNSYASKKKDLILIVSGSAASWMIQHVVDSKGGLHNRLTQQIRLLPFTLTEIEDYLRMRKIKNLDHYQILQLYMAIGGVPYYWSFVQKGLSAAQIIDDLVFSDYAEFRNEYDQLFASLFDNNDLHEKVVEVLAGKRKGLNRKEILSVMKLKSGGTASNIIRELEESGFIESYIPFGKNSNDARFILSDEFTLFHLYWIAPIGKRKTGNAYWIKMQTGSKFKAWSGHSFEGICLKHIEKIKYHLRIDKIQSNEAPWEYKAGKNSKETGVQIDMLIDRKDMVINLCEMKFYQSEFTIDKSYAEELRRKIDVFKTRTNTRKSIFLTIVTTFGLKSNSHSSSLNAIGVSMDALF
ncbi:MAG: AAA family ATPase [Bacteroidales bacterium]|nr:AAA family ATPase [Bacteroidales bacterium]